MQCHWGQTPWNPRSKGAKVEKGLRTRYIATEVGFGDRSGAETLPYVSRNLALFWFHLRPGG